MSTGEPSRYWIFGPLQDMSFVLLTPLPILLIFAAAQRGGWMNPLLTFGLALAMAHYFPGILRAYGDRALFKRFRLRLIVAPIFLTSVTAWFAYRNLHSVLLLAQVWGQWHWMMQVYGFARIYDAKARPEARTPAWLDKTVCLLWFGICVFVLNNDMPSYVTGFYESGGPKLPAGVFASFTRGWVAATVAATLYYVIRTIGAVREGRWPNPLKFVFVVVTFVYLTYTASVVQRPKMGLVLFESWHDIQYLAIVWFFNINRARNAPDAGNFTRFLFRPRAVLVVAYVGMCLVFGSLTHAWSLFGNDTVIRLAASLVTSAGMLHYYLDGFIWKIREKETGQALGVRAGSETGPARVLFTPSFIWPVWARHAALWLLFVIPAVLFFTRETKGSVARPLEIYENVAAAFPASASAQYQLGRQLQDEGRLREAKVHYEQALSIAPDILPAHIFMGILLSDQGDYAAAKPHFERALAMDPQNAELNNDLGIVFDEQSDLQAARRHLERAVALDPQYALAENNLGIVLAKLGDLSKAHIHQERAVRIQPDFADAHYQLGMTIAKEGDLAGAADHFEQALRIDPAQYLIHNSLGEILVKQGQFPEAKSHFEQALRIRPRYAAAQQNLAALQDGAVPDGPGAHFQPTR